MFRYVMDYFWEVHTARQQGGPIAYTEIKAWADLTGVNLTAFEVQVIKRLDILFLKTYREK